MPEPIARRPQQHSRHHCAHPGCPKGISGLVWACLEHWETLPSQIRRKISLQYRDAGESTLLLRYAQEEAFVFWNGLEGTQQTKAS
jgi:hypothetical protein